MACFIQFWNDIIFHSNFSPYSVVKLSIKLEKKESRYLHLAAFIISPLKHS